MKVYHLTVISVMYFWVVRNDSENINDKLKSVLAPHYISF